MEFTLRNRCGQIEVFHVLIILIVTNPRSRHLLSYYDKSKQKVLQGNFICVEFGLRQRMHNVQVPRLETMLTRRTSAFLSN